MKLLSMKPLYPLILLMGLCVIARAQAPSPTTVPTTSPGIDPDLLATLESLDRKSAAVADYTADFEQQKITPLLKKPLTSQGVVKARSGVVLWATRTPTVTVMRMDASAMQLLHVEQKVLEIYPGEWGAMATDPVPRLAVLRKKFVIEKTGQTPDTLTLRLTPREPNLKEHLADTVVEIDLQQSVATRIEMTDPDGEQTVMRFSNYRLNGNLTEADVQLVPPAGTKTVHPLDRAP